MSDRKFYKWFEDQQDLAERCGVSLGPVQFDLMESAWEASRRDLLSTHEYLATLAEDLKDSRLGDVNQLANGILELLEELNEKDS